MSMTRRERLESIINSFPKYGYVRKTFFDSARLDILTDAAIEELAREHLDAFARANRDSERGHATHNRLAGEIAKNGM